MPSTPGVPGNPDIPRLPWEQRSVRTLQDKGVVMGVHRKGGERLGIHMKGWQGESGSKEGIVVSGEKMRVSNANEVQ